MTSCNYLLKKHIAHPTLSNFQPINAFSSIMQTLTSVKQTMVVVNVCTAPISKDRLSVAARRVLNSEMTTVAVQSSFKDLVGQ